MLFSIAALVAWIVGPVMADEPALELQARPTTVRVGDRVQVVVSARGGDGWLWSDVTVAVEPGGAWELVEGPTAVPGSRPPAWEMDLAAMALGDQELPSVTATVRSPDGQTVQVGVADPVSVSVGSVLIDKDDDRSPAPLRDPIGARGFPWEWVLPIVVVLMPLLVGAAWLWSGRGRPLVGVQPPVPPLAELESLTAELDRRVGREPADGICDRLAAGLRHYLERRTGEPAEEMTSFELRLLARRRGWPETTQRLVQRVMGVADGVRFGRRTVADDELRNAIADALAAGRSVETHLTPADEGSDTAEVAS